MNKPMNMTLVGDAKPFNRERRSGGNVTVVATVAAVSVVVTAVMVSVLTVVNSDRRPQGERRSFRREGGKPAPRVVQQ